MHKAVMATYHHITFNNTRKPCTLPNRPPTPGAIKMLRRPRVSPR